MGDAEYGEGSQAAAGLGSAAVVVVEVAAGATVAFAVG